jgi:hypothetical protein
VIKVSKAVPWLLALLKTPSHHRTDSLDSELQGTIVWMASDASTYLNGSDVVVSD